MQQILAQPRNVSKSTWNIINQYKYKNPFKDQNTGYINLLHSKEKSIINNTNNIAYIYNDFFTNFIV